MTAGEISDTPSPFGPGAIIAGKYRVERVIGRGGMGLVLEAKHLHLDHPVAIKFLLAEAAEAPGAAARFLREARAAARIRSEHVARVFDSDITPEGAPYLVMELLVGTDLHRLVRGRGSLPIAEAIDYLLQACEALAEAHTLGIVHRDLKPGNLFLTRRLDGTPLVKLLDFGIAKTPDTGWSEAGLTVARGTLGSPLYMSPEQLDDTSSVDLRTDIWALGIVLFELLTGRHPFEAASQAAFGARIAAGAPESLGRYFDDAPAGLDAVIARCLTKDPTARFESVGAFAEALRPFAGETSRASLERIASVSVVSTSNHTVLAVPKPASRPPSRDGSGPRPSVAMVPKTSESGPLSGVRAPTENFRRQHEELAAMGSEILQRLMVSADEIAVHAGELRRAMARFAGKLTVHASMENEALYPRLLAHRDEAVREKAGALFREVKTLYGSFSLYSKRWPTTASIEADPAAFARDTKKVLMTLWMRMQRENDELYPLVDRAPQ